MPGRAVRGVGLLFAATAAALIFTPPAYAEEQPSPPPLPATRSAAVLTDTADAPEPAPPVTSADTTGTVADVSVAITPPEPSTGQIERETSVARGPAGRHEPPRQADGRAISRVRTLSRAVVARTSTGTPHTQASDPQRWYQVPPRQYQRASHAGPRRTKVKRADGVPRPNAAASHTNPIRCAIWSSKCVAFCGPDALDNASENGRQITPCIPAETPPRHPRDLILELILQNAHPLDETPALRPWCPQYQSESAQYQDDDCAVAAVASTSRPSRATAPPPREHIVRPLAAAVPPLAATGEERTSLTSALDQRAAAVVPHGRRLLPSSRSGPIAANGIDRITGDDSTEGSTDWFLWSLLVALAAATVALVAAAVSEVLGIRHVVVDLRYRIQSKGLSAKSSTRRRRRATIRYRD
jgi:hypothetical protein